jgi:hypothetical protein
MAISTAIEKSAAESGYPIPSFPGNEKQTFYISFGGKSPFRDGWVELKASNYACARQAAFDSLGDQWANIYTEEKFDRSYFPAGKIGHTIYGA